MMQYPFYWGLGGSHDGTVQVPKTSTLPEFDPLTLQFVANRLRIVRRVEIWAIIKYSTRKWFDFLLPRRHEGECDDRKVIIGVCV